MLRLAMPGKIEDGLAIALTHVEITIGAGWFRAWAGRSHAEPIPLVPRYPPLPVSFLDKCCAIIWVRGRIASLGNAPEPTEGCLILMFRPPSWILIPAACFAAGGGT